MGRKKEKRGIADYGYMICICHLRDFIIPIYGEIGIPSYKVLYRAI